MQKNNDPSGSSKVSSYGDMKEFLASHPSGDRLRQEGLTGSRPAEVAPDESLSPSPAPSRPRKPR